MEIELSNGKLKFWQWDTGQKIQVPENVPTIHFKFGSSAVEFPVTDRWTDVPDELLQTGKDILLWTYKEDHTLDTARIPVEERTKPADYIYTPTEIKTWESLDARIKALEDGGGVSGVSSINGQTGAVTITAEGLGALTEDDLQSATNAALAQAKASGEFDGAQGPKGDPGAAGPTGPAGAGLDVTGATVGQIVKISAVDDNGVPTAWEPVDMASKETWEKIADVALTADVSEYQLADFGTYRKVKALISRSAYVSGLNKNVWFRIRSKTIYNDVIAATYVTGEYGYIALEINAEMGDMFTRAGTAITNNRQKATYDKRTIDVVSPTNPSGYGLYMMFVDTSVIQSGDTVAVYGVKR
nr:MAG TPA: nucleoid-associated protein [Caudoviricetes sp.]